jgi:hypothetical protein
MGGFLLLRVNAGLNDALSLLWKHTEFAKRDSRTIIFVLEAYPACNLEDVIDFSNYPVPVLCGTSHYDKITYSRIHPTCFGYDFKKKTNSVTSDGTMAIDGVAANFDITKVYPASTLVVFAGCGNFGFSLEVFKHIKLRPHLVNRIRSLRSCFPSDYLSIHLRATDHPEQDRDVQLQKIDSLLASNPGKMAYLACDNMSLMKSLSEKYSQIIKSPSFVDIDADNRPFHYEMGHKDPMCIENALVDIFVCASACDFLPSVGGYTRLIEQLYNSKNLLHSLI